jgi:hypothetical protein
MTSPWQPVTISVYASNIDVWHAVVDAQNSLTDSVMSQCHGREQLKDLITELMDYPRHGIPFKRGGPCARAA